MQETNISDQMLTALIKKYNAIRYPGRDNDNNYYIKSSLYLLEQIQSQEFRITIVGEFSSGKSTFLNAIIGRDILPHASSETTATVTYIYNVSQDDARRDQVVVRFTDKEKSPLTFSLLTNPDVLREFATTMSSKHHVVSEIRSIDIFVHMHAVREPVVLIDTPGLNGVAAGHREVTMREIQKAHASIYLFPVKSISNTDLEFLKILFDYQQAFLFVLNFIDELKESEGETCEQKLKELKSNLGMRLYDGKVNEANHITVFGISALKALAAKDYNIKHLYHDDKYDLHPSDRERIWQESRFSVLETALWHEVLQGKRQAIFTNSILRTLLSLVEEELAELQGIQKLLNKKLIQPELERIESYRRECETHYEKHWKKIDNYINSEEWDLRRKYEEFIKSECEKKFTDLEKIIGEATFDDFFRAVDTNTYGLKVQQKIGELNEKYRENLVKSLEEILLSAVVRIRNAGEQLKIEISDNGKVSFKLPKVDPEPVNIADPDPKEAEHKKIKQTISDIIKEKENKTDQVNRFNQEILRIEQKLQQNKKDQQQEEQRLGAQPPIDAITHKVTIKKQREGFFGGLTDWIFGEKEETETQTVYDSTKRDAWLKKKKDVQRKYENEIHNLERQRKNLELNIKHVNQDITSNEEKLNLFIERLSRVKEEMKQKVEDRERQIKVAKAEYLKSQKNKILAAIDKVIQVNNQSKMIEQMKKDVPRFIVNIKEAAQDRYNQIKAKHIKEVDTLLQKNETDQRNLQERNAVIDELDKLSNEIQSILSRGENSGRF